MSIQTDKLMNLGDGKVLYDDLRERVDSQSVPIGGLEGQVLTKKSGKARDAKWQSIPHELPPYGGDGDVLYKNTGSDYDVKWGAPKWILDYATKENYSNQEPIYDAADGQPIGFKITLPLVQEGSGDPAIDNIRKFKKYTEVYIYTNGPDERSSSVTIDLTGIPGGVYGGVLEVTKDGNAIFTRSHYVFGYDSGSSTQYGDYVFISKYANLQRNYIRSTDFSASSFSTVTGIDKDKVCYEPPVLNGAVSMPYYATVPYGTNTYDLSVAVGLNMYLYYADRYTLPKIENLPISYADDDGHGGFTVGVSTNYGTLNTPIDITYVISPKAYTDSKATVQDVQVNGTSVVSNGVANVPIASASGLGVSGIEGSFGILINNNGKLYTNTPNLNEIKAGSQGYKPIVPANVHSAAFYGLAKAARDTTQSSSSNAVGQYTDEAKVAIQKMLGIYEAPWELIREDEVTHAASDILEITTDGNGQAFELTDIRLLIQIPSQGTDFSVLDYGVVSAHCTDETSRMTISLIGSNPYNVAANSSKKIALLEIETNSGMSKISCLQIQNENGIANQQVPAYYSAATSYKEFLLGYNAFNKLKIPAFTGTIQYRLYGKRKWT